MPAPDPDLVNKLHRSFAVAGRESESRELLDEAARQGESLAHPDERGFFARSHRRLARRIEAAR